MSEITNKVTTKHEIKGEIQATTKHEIRGEIQATKIYPKLENLTVTPTNNIQSFNHPDSYGYDNVVIKAIEGETLNVTPKKEDQVFDGIYTEVIVEGTECETLNITPNQESQSFKGFYDEVNVEAINSEILNVTPKQESQSFKGLYEQVNVEAIQADQLTVTPNAEEQYFSGMFDNVTVEAVESDVIISPTEPTGDDRKKIWIQKVRNMLTVQKLTKTQSNNCTVSYSSNTNKVASKGAWGWCVYQLAIPSNFKDREMVLSFDGVSTHEFGNNISSTVLLVKENDINSERYGYVRLNTTKQRYALTFSPIQEYAYIVVYCTLSNTSIVTMELSNIQLEAGGEATDYIEYVEPTTYIKDTVSDEYEKLSPYSEI